MKPLLAAFLVLGCSAAGSDACKGDTCEGGGAFVFDPNTSPDVASGPAQDVVSDDSSGDDSSGDDSSIDDSSGDDSSVDDSSGDDSSGDDSSGDDSSGDGADGGPDVPEPPVDVPVTPDTHVPMDIPDLPPDTEPPDTVVDDVEPPDVQGPCGDGTLDDGEACDWAIAPGAPGACPSACADPPGCTGLVLEGTAESCTAHCVTTFVTALVDGDGCCPPAGSPATDSDCVQCGNGKLDAGETCDDSAPGAPCPTSCAPPAGCEVHQLAGAAAACTAHCETSTIVEAADGDGCCPVGLTNDSDKDCVPVVCGDGKIGPGEECDGAALGGATCAKWGYPSGAASCLPDCTLSSLLCPGSHLLLYEPTTNIAIVDDLTRVRWHPTGDMAVVLGTGGKVGRYDPGTKSLALATTLAGRANDLDAHPDGTYFLVAGTSTDGKTAKVWRLDVDLDTLEFAATELPQTLTGTPVVVVHTQDPDASAFLIGTYVSSGGGYQNRIYRWDADAVIDSKAYAGSAGLQGLAYAPAGLSPYPGSAAVITSEGYNGTGSQSWVLATNIVVGNGWPGSNGNSGRGAWRPGGTYGVFAATSTSGVYVLDGSWKKSYLVGLGSAATAIAVDWRPDGSRALAIARPILGAAKVFDHRPSGASYNGDWIDVSLPGFDSPPYNASSNTTLYDVDWRPGSACDEGLIAASDNGSQFSPSLGLLVRFYDQDDPDCP